ncbi:hypothetical protein O9993_08410 [Vibrio lentus]|nr:hypothetical protein [Vibrio lentus]
MNLGYARWVKPAINQRRASSQITMAGLEVDDVEPVAGEFCDVKVGKVVEVRSAPRRRQTTSYKKLISAKKSCCRHRMWCI